MFGFTRKPPYTQEQIKEQMNIVREVIQQRDKLASTMSESNGEYGRATTAVECAQEILNYMLEEVAAYGRKGGRISRRGKAGV